MSPVSWVSLAPDSGFGMHNIPYGVFSNRNGRKAAGTAVGDQVLDLGLLQQRGLLLAQSDCFQQGTLNQFMGMGRSVWQEARRQIQELLQVDNGTLRDDEDLRSQVLLPQAEVTMHLPADIPDYTDFYASREHATTCGEILRGKDNALQPNWLHLPVAYHGRSSSIVLSGTPVRRPRGQTASSTPNQPQWAPCKFVDFELEMAAFVGGPANELGTPVSAAEAGDRIFGLVLMNDWSARDLQAWEMAPLGPFTAKNWATTISPWIVTLDALQPFRCAAPVQDPAPLAYLAEPDRHTFDIALTVEIAPAGASSASIVTQSNFKHLYWTIQQMIAHHTVGGCNLRPGDLLGTGTISAPGPKGQGSLLEQTRGGKQPVQLLDEQQRISLQAGDEVTLRGLCQASGRHLSFGTCTGKVMEAL